MKLHQTTNTQRDITLLQKFHLQLRPYFFLIEKFHFNEQFPQYFLKKKNSADHLILEAEASV